MCSGSGHKGLFISCSTCTCRNSPNQLGQGPQQGRMLLNAIHKITVVLLIIARGGVGNTKSWLRTFYSSLQAEILA